MIIYDDDDYPRLSLSAETEAHDGPGKALDAS